MNNQSTAKFIFLSGLVVMAGSVSAQDPSQYTVGNDALLTGLAPDGWTQVGDVEHYGVKDLYVKINGRSEMYMAYDVVGLSYVSFSNKDDRSQFIDVFTYDMSNPTGAFGVYAVEREPGQPKVELGREGYKTDSNLYFWKGQYYVYVQSSDSGEKPEAAALAVAQGIAARLSDSGEAVQGIDLLPTKGLLVDTVQYFKVDALSLDFMTETYAARYKVGSLEATFFVSMRDSEEDAQSVVAQFVEYMEDYGDGMERASIGGGELAFADMGGGFFDGIFQMGKVVAGVTAIRGRDAALEAAKAELKLLKDHFASK